MNNLRGIREERMTDRSWRIIKRSWEYIEAHLSEVIAINDVCAYAAVSLSNLERTYRRELKMSPIEYIRARRLSAVNHELKRANSNGKKIGQVALDYGFNHHGRFAGHYHAQFGELPSETMKSN